MYLFDEKTMKSMEIPKREEDTESVRKCDVKTYVEFDFKEETNLDGFIK